MRKMKKKVFCLIMGALVLSSAFAGCKITSKSSETSETSVKATETSTVSKAEETKAAEKKETTAEKVVYDNNGLKITYIGMREGAISQNVQFRIENNSNTDYVIQSDDVDINDYTFTPLFSVEVNKGKKATDEMSFLSSDLEKNKIEEIEKIEFTFKFLDPDTFETKFTSDPIIINP